MFRSWRACAVSLVLSLLFAIPAGADRPDCPAEVTFGWNTERTSEVGWSRSLLTVASTKEKVYLPTEPIGEQFKIWSPSCGSSPAKKFSEPVRATLEALTCWLNAHGCGAGLYVSFTGKLDEAKAVGAISLVGLDAKLSEDDLLQELAAAGAGVDVHVRKGGAPAKNCAVQLCSLRDGRPVETDSPEQTDDEGHCFIAFRDYQCRLGAGEYVMKVNNGDDPRSSAPFALTPPQTRTERYVVSFDLAAPSSDTPGVDKVARTVPGESSSPEIPEVGTFRPKPEFRTGAGIPVDGGGIGLLLTVDLPKEPDVKERREGEVTVYAQPTRVYWKEGWSDFVELTAESEAERKEAVDFAWRAPRWGWSIGALSRGEDLPGGAGWYYIPWPSHNVRFHLIVGAIPDWEDPAILGVSLGLGEIKELFIQ